MPSLELSPPCDVVPADAADSLVQAVRLELAALEDELRRASLAAVDLEGSDEGEGLLAADDALVMEQRLRAFLDDWLRHEERQLHEMIEAAQERADSRLQRARVEATAILQTARTEAEARLVLPPPPEPTLRLAPAPFPSAVVETPVGAITPPAALVAPAALHPSNGALDDVDSTAAALARVVADALSGSAATVPATDPAAEPAEPAKGTSWFDDALAALELDDPGQALAAAAAATETESTETDEPTDVEHGPAAGDAPGEPAIAGAEPGEEYAHFWKGEEDATAARQRVRSWAPLQLLLPMLVVLGVLVLVGLWIG